LLHILFSQSIYRWDGDKLVQVQKWDGKESTLTRYVEGDELVMVWVVQRYHFISCLLLDEEKINKKLMLILMYLIF